MLKDDSKEYYDYHVEQNQLENNLLEELANFEIQILENIKTTRLIRIITKYKS